MSKNFFLSILTISLLWACAANKATVDYDTSIEFSAYKTYAWSDKTDKQTNKSKIDTPLVHKRVRESIEAALGAKGLQRVDTERADILLTYHLSVAVAGHTSSSVSLGIGSSGRHSSVGLSVGVPLGSRVVEEGTLVIDIINSKGNSVIWRGTASRQLSTSPTPEKTKAAIEQVVSEILAEYPPKK